MTSFTDLFNAPLEPTDEVDATAIETDEVGRIADPEALKFVLAGKAIFTLQSLRTGTRFTYKVERAKDKPHMYFVSVLTGPENNDYRNYSYFGMIFTDKGQPVFRFGNPAKVRVGADATSVRMFVWAFERLLSGFGHRQLAVFHAGLCGRCGRLLTTPESITRGIGPECLKHWQG